ncbi:MAG TPA: hypothetical protein VGZ24_01345 [Chthoniobacterales bacterium]|nr:hypothetical protein [Chthoniobacterales bacterium]
MSPVWFPTVVRSLVRTIALVVGGGVILTAYSLRADGTSDVKQQASTTTTEEEAEYKNWIELGIGGLIINGDSAQFKQEHRMSGDVFGGIQDMHYEQTVGKDAALSVDGHAIFDNNDYDVKIDLSKPKVGYIRAGYTEFRNWYDGNGGFFPHNDVFFSPPFPEMHIDRGEAWVELGLRLPDWPEITLHYSHQFRDGQKDSTIWGDTTLTGLTVQPTRKIAPAYRDINETRDIFAVDALKTFGNTDVGLGMRMEFDNNDDRLQIERNPRELPPVVPAPGAQRFITQNDKNKVDLFSGHATTETRFSDSLWFTTAYSYTTLGSDLAGTRIYGTHYNASFSDPIVTLQPGDPAAPLQDEGFLNLAGGSQVEQHVVNLNLMWVPLKNLTVLTAFRYTLENKESDSIYLDTNPTPNVPPFTPANPAGGFHQDIPILTSSDSSETFNKFAERMELRYTGIANWLFYAEGEWEEEYGDIHERQVAAGMVDSANKNLSLLWQKYTAGFNWYPLDRLNLSAQYYHKILEYDNESTGAHQSLVYQKWNTDDVNVRITWRPRIPPCLGTLALVSRYDFVTASIEGQWETPAQTLTLQPEHTALIANHMITESITWNPLARLYLQGDLSYVLNQTKTPAANIDLIPYTNPSVLNFRNDYWTVAAGAGYVLDAKTDLRVDYSFYRANDYSNNDLVGMPYGMGATEHALSATISRQLAKNVRLTLKYSYFNYTDETSGGHNNYEAHSVYSTLQFRF